MQEYRRITLDGVRYYGKHLILTARECSEALLDIPTVTRFMRELVDRIDMVAFGQPVIARFGGGIEVGISAVQLIETSAIVIHTNDQARDLYLDVFSCKTFSEAAVIDFVREYFSPEGIQHQVLLR
jgi:S-adenosylmethionine/arginine decarboxylase-like enzyme